MHIIAQIVNILLRKINFPVLAENELLVSEIRRVEKAIQALEVPTHISKECLSNRQRRLDTDLVQDNAENQLLKVSPLRF